MKDGCWSCGAAPGEDITCSSCGALVAHQPSDHFQALGLPRRMGLDRREVDRAFRARSKRVHPDRFSGRSSIERRLAVQHTTALNDAYEVVKRPARRAQYLLELLGRDLSSESSRTDDPELLMEMMSLRERLDSTADAELDDLDRELKAAIQAELSAAEAFFDRQEGGLDEVASRLERVRYLERLREGVAVRADSAAETG